MGLMDIKLLFMCKLCVLTIITTSLAATILETEEFLTEPPRYYSDKEIFSEFSQLAKKYPDKARVLSIGKSGEERDLIAIEISGNVRQRSDLVPMFKYVGNMHGDETIGRQMLVYLARYLLDNYGLLPEVTQLVDTTDIFLLPSMNPDGFVRSIVSEIKFTFYFCF